VEQRPETQEDDGRPQESPVPPDAPVETPEADPRTEGAPDPVPDSFPDPAEDSEGPLPADPSSPSSTEEQIQQAFE
jgi:hypothetical protein